MKVQDYFSGKSIFITGGTGFVGKALIEKFLRSCPDLENIYVLIRGKRSLSAQERLRVITENILFKTLKNSNPNALSKLIVIEGDVTKLNLGISETDRRLLAEKVNFIFHTAASVRFDDHLRDSIFVNVRSTREIIKLAYELKNLSMFVYVSTAYCNVDKRVVEEKVYPAHGDWKEAIRVAEGIDDRTILETMTMKYIEPMPNTYTYAKRLAECVVVDMCEGKIPAIIFRPSVVVSTFYEPFPGWNDNFNGPVGLLVAGGKGLLRTVYGQPDTMLDFIPVDTFNRLVIAGTAEQCKTGKVDEVNVYNCCTNKYCPLSLQYLIEMGVRLIDDVPFRQVLWYPRFSLTSCWYNYYIQVLLFHMIPAFFIDMGLRLAGKNPMLFKIQRKIYTANNVMFPFLTQSWSFVNNNIFHTLETFSPEDMDDFNGIIHFDVIVDKYYSYYRQACIGVGLCQFKEEFDEKINRKLMRRRWMLDVFVKIILGSLFCWYLFMRVQVVRAVNGYIQEYFVP